MKRSAILGIASLLGACATAESRTPTAKWLAGTWLETSSDPGYPTACASGLPIRYRQDGTYLLFEQSGTWRLEGDRLTEIATAASEVVIDPAEVPIGIPFVSRIERRGQDEFQKTYVDGIVETFRRCPSP